MAIVKAQTASHASNSGSSVTATLGSTPTNNNYLIAVYFETLAGLTTPSVSLPSGWSWFTGHPRTEVLGANRTVAGIAYKRVSGDGTSVQFSSDASSNKDLDVVEIFGLSATSVGGPSDSNPSSGSTGSTSSVQLGSTGTLPLAVMYAVGLVAFDDGGTSGGGTSADSGFSVINAGNRRDIAVDKITASTASLNPTVSWSSLEQVFGMIVTFKGVTTVGTAAATQASQTGSASGVVGDERLGEVAATQEGDHFSAFGKLIYTGSAAPTVPNETTAATGIFIALGTGVGTGAQADQFAAASGWRGFKLANSWIEPVGDPFRRAGILHPVDVSQSWVLDSALTFFEGRSYPVSARGEQQTVEWTITTRWPVAERLHAEVFLELLREIAQQTDARMTVHIAAPPGGSDVEFVGECHEVPQELAPSNTDFTLTFRQVDA